MISPQFDFDDCEFNDLTDELPGNTPIKITVDAPNVDPLDIKVSDWRDIMKARIFIENGTALLRGLFIGALG